MTKELHKAINELLGITADVSSSYAVWRELTNAENRDVYECTKQTYEDFFVTVDRSTLAMVINGLYMLLENRQDTHNLRSALQHQRSLGRIYEVRVDTWLDEVNSWKATITKIATLRSNIFAHRGGKLTSSEFAVRAGITPDEIGELIRNVETLLKAFAEATLPDIIALPFAGRTAASTRELMQTLTRID